ncbi:helix-turn-helix transcriptional regulator [Steroidobacter cummioxidans]|uniref:helix-turn-helix transcriptional regulator n=1 Tax=Steroidobacter cummioxidans TaxID=1803913 RepID=UPI000E320D96|nr:helix-turn-helix transcriptional regulator [Steroidobacter cummioxidans]
MHGVDVADDSIESAFAKILACTDHSNVDAQLLRPVAARIAATSGVYFRFTGAPRADCYAASYSYAGDTPEAAEVYLDHYFRLDPVVRSGLRWLHHPQAPIELVSGLSASSVDLHDHAYRDAFLYRYNIGHVMALIVPCPIASGPQLMCIGFHRCVDDRPFQAHEVRVFERLAPAITSAMRLLAYQDAERLSHDVLHSLSLTGGVGYVILDHDLAIENANARGLADLDVSPINGAAALLGEVRRLLICGELSVDGDGRNVFTTGGSRPLEISVSRLRSPAGRERYLLLTSEPLTARLLNASTQLFALTERESEIARLVAAGLCNAGIAIELRIALRTVENHLRSIYAKADVSSRTQLVSKLLRLQ